MSSENNAFNKQNENTTTFVPLARGTPEYYERAQHRRDEAKEKSSVTFPPEDELERLSLEGLRINNETAADLESKETLVEITESLETMLSKFGLLFEGGDRAIFKSLALKLRDHGSDYLVRAGRMDLVESLSQASEDWEGVSEMVSWVEENVFEAFPDKKDAIIAEAKRQFIEDIRLDSRNTEK